MSLLPCITYANPNTPLYGAGGSGSSASTFNTLTVSSILSVGPPGQVLVYTDLDTKLKTSVDAGTSTIREVMTNGSGTQITPALVFQPETNSFIVQDTTSGKSFMVATNGGVLTIPAANVSTLAMGPSAIVSFEDTLSIGRTGDTLSMSLSQVGNDNVSMTLATPNNDNSIVVGGDGGAGKITVQNGPLQIFASDLAVYSSITTFNLGISSINNSAYPPQGSGAVSTIGFSAANFPGGAGTVPLGGTPFAMTDSFTVDPTHRYRVSYEAAYTNVDGSPSYTTAYISGTSPAMYITTLDNRQAIPALNDARASVSAVFIPNIATCQVITQNSSAAAGTSMTVNNVVGITLEDLGAW